MKILLATENFYGSFRELFPDDDISVVSSSDEFADLVIFTGGEDVNPALYIGGEELQDIKKHCYYNPARDEREKSVFHRIMLGSLAVNKVLGVCRGLQFINVMLGGTLFYDLPMSEKGHKSIHEIFHKMKSPLDFLKFVNSMHHQAILNLGSVYSRDDAFLEFSPKILAIEPTTNIIEMIKWSGVLKRRNLVRMKPDSIIYERQPIPTIMKELSLDILDILAVQFHPEFFPSIDGDLLENRKRLSEAIRQWVNTKK